MPTEFTLSQAAKEKSTFLIDVAFTDEDGVSMVPTALKWSLLQDDKSTIVNSRNEISLTPASSVTITLSGDDLVVDAGKRYTWRYLVIEGTYNGTLGNDLPIKDQLKFPIENLAKVPA